MITDFEKSNPLVNIAQLELLNFFTGEKIAMLPSA